MKYKDIPRRKFTEKQLEMLEKLNWLRKQEQNYNCFKFGYFEICEKLCEVDDKVSKFLG